MKKILILAFVSATFFFGCSADFNDVPPVKPPTWSAEPSTEAPSTNGGGREFCLFYDPRDGEEWCERIPYERGYTEEDCYDEGGEPVNASSCPRPR